MSNILKNVRNIVVFGIILYIVNFILNFIVDKIFNLINLDNLYDTNMILYTIITMGIGIILYLIAMIITKKLFSIKIKIHYKEAKKMLLILLIIFLIIEMATFINSYYSSIKVEEEINNMMSEFEQLKASDEYKSIEKSTRDMADSIYKIYSEGKDEILKLEEEKRNIMGTKLIANIFLYIICLYFFGLFLYRKD